VTTIYQLDPAYRFQSISFPKSKWKKSEAQKWALGHAFFAGEPKYERSFFTFKQADPRDFQPLSFVTIWVDEGLKIRAVIGRPKEKKKAKTEVNPSLVCPRNVALLGLVTLIEYKAGGKSHVLKFPGRHQKQTAKKQFCLMLGEPKKRAMFASAKQRLLGHADPARSTAPARSLLKSWASYAASNVLKLEVADLKCATLIGEVVAIEYESQKWSGTTWTLYRHEFDRPADLYRSKSGGLYGIVRRDQKTIVTPRGIVG
jgi:hypothetical protein